MRSYGCLTRDILGVLNKTYFMEWNMVHEVAYLFSGSAFLRAYPKSVSVGILIFNIYDVFIYSKSSNIPVLFEFCP